MAKKAAKQVVTKAPKQVAKPAAKRVVKKANKQPSAKHRVAPKRPFDAPAVLSLTHSLESLLHTMRSIAQHEDELCTLLHDARRNGRMSAPLLRELQAVLEALPAEEYTSELQAVRDMTAPA